MQLKTEKNFFASAIVASELVSLNRPYEEQHTFYREPMCEQGVTRFCMSIKKVNKRNFFQ